MALIAVSRAHVDSSSGGGETASPAEAGEEDRGAFFACLSGFKASAESTVLGTPMSSVVAFALIQEEYLSTDTSHHRTKPAHTVASRCSRPAS